MNRLSHFGSRRHGFLVAKRDINSEKQYGSPFVND